MQSRSHKALLISLNFKYSGLHPSFLSFNKYLSRAHLYQYLWPDTEAIRGNKTNKMLVVMSLLSKVWGKGIETENN